MHLRLQLMGPLTVTETGGKDLTPGGRKARGMLALLGTAAGMRMARAQLQDRLWSQSAPAQGAASLRQTLHELRQVLGPALTGGDGWVGLDPEWIRVDLKAIPGPGGQHPEFAEGLEIDDPEFEDWLRDMRLSLEDRPEQAELVLVLEDAQGESAQARMLADVVLQEAAGRAGALIPARVLRQPDRRAAGPGLTISAACLGQPDNGGLMMLTLRQLGTGAQLWAQHYPLSPVLRELRLTGGMIALMMIQVATRTRPGHLHSLDGVFSFSRARLLAADQRLQQADGAVPAALRAFLRYTLIIERQAPDPRRALEEAEAQCRLAREAAPADPVALAISALMQSWRGDVPGALELARLACRVSPGHDLAHFALSQALSDAGRDSDALTALRRGDGGPLALMGQASWQARLALVHLRLGRLPEAEAAAAAALAHAPDCRPALRILAALRHHRGDEAGAVEALAALRRIEPDFSLTLMASPEYPVTTLRRAGLLGITRSGL